MRYHNRVRYALESVIPFEPIKSFDDLQAGDPISVWGYGWEWLKWVSVGGGAIELQLRSPLEESPLPRDPRFKGGAEVATTYTISGENVLVTPATVKKAGIPSPRHPLDYCRLDPEYHYPRCCGKFWPCDDAHNAIKSQDRESERHRKDGSCSECGNWFYGSRLIKFGSAPDLKFVGRGLARTAVWAPGTVRAVGEGFQPVSAEAKTRKFCHKSGCVTAARRFGERIGHPIPGTRKQLEADLKKGTVEVPWPQPQPATETTSVEYGGLTLVTTARKAAD